jgi:hypothetical protein
MYLALQPVQTFCHSAMKLSLSTSEFYLLCVDNSEPWKYGSRSFQTFMNHSHIHKDKSYLFTFTFKILSRQQAEKYKFKVESFVALFFHLLISFKNVMNKFI